MSFLACGLFLLCAPFLKNAFPRLRARRDFRGDFSKFRKMGSQKPRVVLHLLESHGFDGVVLSDVDTAWLRDPTDFMLRHPTADVFMSTDCLSHQVRLQMDRRAVCLTRQVRLQMDRPVAPGGCRWRRAVCLARQVRLRMDRPVSPGAAADG
jgi:Nucleotide-diphospho-sugar transferase